MLLKRRMRIPLLGDPEPDRGKLEGRPIVRRLRATTGAVALQSEQAATVSLRATYQNTDEKNANAPNDHLERCPKKWRIHVAFADPANDQ